MLIFDRLFVSYFVSSLSTFLKTGPEWTLSSAELLCHSKWRRPYSKRGFKTVFALFFWKNWRKSHVFKEDKKTGALSSFWAKLLEEKSDRSDDESFWWWLYCMLDWCRRWERKQRLEESLHFSSMETSTKRKRERIYKIELQLHHDLVSLCSPFLQSRKADLMIWWTKREVLRVFESLSLSPFKDFVLFVWKLFLLPILWETTTTSHREDHSDWFPCPSPVTKRRENISLLSASSFPKDFFQLHSCSSRFAIFQRTCLNNRTRDDVKSHDESCLHLQAIVFWSCRDFVLLHFAVYLDCVGYVIILRVHFFILFPWVQSLDASQ